MSSSDSNKNSDDKTKETKRFLEERRDEANLVNRFKEVGVNRLQKMIEEADEAKIQYELGEAESKLILSRDGSGLTQGAIAGLVTFAILRRGPVYLARYVVKRRMQAQQQKQQHYSHPWQSNQSQPFGHNSSKTSVQQPPPSQPPSSASSSSNQVNPFQNAQIAKETGASSFYYSPLSDPHFPRSKNFIIRSIWFMFDAVVSLMAASVVSLASMDGDKAREKVISIPLVEGRSLLSDALCEDIAMELAKVQQEQLPVYDRLRKEYKRNTTKTDTSGWSNDSTISRGTIYASKYLQGVLDLVANCERRRAMEQQIRDENGLSKHDPVSIPPPGVPRDGPRLRIAPTQQEGEDGPSSSSDDDSEWVLNFVSDKEEGQDQSRRF